MRPVLGECLRHAGVITSGSLEAALEEQRRSGGRIGSVIVRLGLATERQVAQALAVQLGFPYVEVVECRPEPAALVLLQRQRALEHGCVAIATDGATLTLAMSDPLMFGVVRDLEFQTGCRIRQVVTTPGQIAAAVEAWYPNQALTVSDAPAPGLSSGDRGEPALVRQDAGGRPEEPFEDPGAAPAAEAAAVVEMVDLVITTAIRHQASDIHIEPTEEGVVVRLRLDGLLKALLDVPRWMHDGIVARVKVLAGLDIAERRLPQDGRIRTRAGGDQEIDLRVSTLRTIFGEKVVLRILDHRRGVPPLDELGMSGDARVRVREFLRHQHGMILVAGPTGSGKTTTLSSALAEIRSEQVNIVTVEDPVEYQVRGVNQTQVHPAISLTFAGALRSILRQDPDVLLVGEIRDLETARMAMQAAQTGHLVLSTLHTDGAPSAVARLADMGIEPYVTASTVIGVIAQRLVRRLCVDCRRASVPDSATTRALGIPIDDMPRPVLYVAEGCPRCHGTGYRGRIGIYEVMAVDAGLRQLIVQGAAETQVRDAALASGMVSLAEDGLAKVRAGLTSPDELLRVVTLIPARLRCSRCRTDLRPWFAACPSCGDRIRTACRHCGRPVDGEWRFCPSCTQPIAATRQVAGQPVDAA